MEKLNSRKPSHKEWRRIAKKERRRRLRQKAAQERDAQEESLRAALENNLDYLNWQKEQDRLEIEKEAREEKERAERERLWLEEEVRKKKCFMVAYSPKVSSESRFNFKRSSLIRSISNGSVIEIPLRKSLARV